MLSKLSKVLKALTCAVLIAQLSGCGTIMYPHRRGQQSGKIDAGVAVLDGVGLLLFLIPGIIAFAVDFGTGAIYLPGTSSSSVGLKKIKVVKFDARRSNDRSLEKIIKRETGLDVEFKQSVMRVSRLNSTDEIEEEFAKAADRYRK